MTVAGEGVYAWKMHEVGRWIADEDAEAGDPTNRTDMRICRREPRRGTGGPRFTPRGLAITGPHTAASAGPPMTAIALDLHVTPDVARPAPAVHARTIDEERAAAAVSNLLEALGLDPGDDGLTDTPRRVARMFAELLSPEPYRPTTFPNDAG